MQFNIFRKADVGGHSKTHGLWCLRDMDVYYRRLTSFTSVVPKSFQRDSINLGDGASAFQAITDEISTVKADVYEVPSEQEIW